MMLMPFSLERRKQSPDDLKNTSDCQVSGNLLVMYLALRFWLHASTARWPLS